MTTFDSARSRTEGAFRGLFDRSGFALHRIVPTVSPVSVIEAAPAG